MMGAGARSGSKAEALYRAGRLAEASAEAQAVLARRPGHAPSLTLLARIALRIGQPATAVALLQGVPEDPDRLNLRGEGHRALGQEEEAAAAYERALALDPRHVAALVNLGVLRQSQRRFGEAFQLYEKAVGLAPKLASLRSNLGALFLAVNMLEPAEEQLRLALALDGEDESARLAFADLRLLQGRAAEAEAEYRRVLAVRPDHPLARLHLAHALKAQGAAGEALALYRDLRAAAPQDPTFLWNEGLCRLLLGDLPAGWDGFEARFAAGAAPPPATDAATPIWSGGLPFAGTLLLQAEQGLGDTIQMVRFAALLKRRGVERIVLACQAPLVDLLRGAEGLDEVVADSAPLPAHDARLPLMSLPHRLRIGGEDIPPAPYLAADPARAAIWRSRIGAEGMRVGLVWQGQRQHRNDRNRSIPAGALAALSAAAPAGIRWFSLQKDASPEDLAGLQAGLPGLADLGPELTSFAETAAAISALDLVIAVDTAVAHLAGALGKPVWLLLAYEPDWRWGLGRAESPWYAQARLFRQTAPGDWAGVVAEVAAALGARAGAYPN